jgi:conjugal transfer/type IV secretion protein DotA/TraY
MSGFFVSIAMIGLTAGFILFYILPFLPFIYFFFAVGAWVKTIFEAMVGAPLWALAHLRIDGEGFPGRSAANGYFLIFEIFVRPILTLFGLLGGMAIFTAMAVILNDLFSFVVFQITGTELSDTAGSGAGGGAGDSVYTGEYESFRRSIVDEFFYTVLYAMLLYMIGLASFKMIDLVPNNILRWMGAGVSSYADQAGDPKEGLVQYAAMGGYKIGGDILGATNKLGGGLGSLAGGVANLGKTSSQPSGSGGGNAGGGTPT